MVQLHQLTITSEIDHTGGAALYRGHRSTDQKQVMIRLLKGDEPDRRALMTLRHEHAILSDLCLEGVVRAYGLEEHGSSLALVLEDPGGILLSALLQARRIDLEAALKIGASVAGALQRIHGQHVIHKDIKPHNIMVQPGTWTATLIGFGIAVRLSRGSPGAKRLDAQEGTLAYMSPEQTGRMNRAVDDRTDLYSLGVTLYEALTGSLPFRSADPVELIHSHIARRPAPPREVCPEIPEVVSAIVMKLLSKAAEDRYHSAGGLKADLDECLARLSANGRIDAFPLGRRDSPHKLHVPQKLYGREEECRALAGAWERATRGAAELFLVSGHAGVGKSALIHEIQRLIARDRGHFIAGKFDQLSRGTPYAPIAHALRELIRSLLSEPEEALAGWRSRLLGALGSNGQLLVALVPELELVIGPQPAVPALGPTESQNRFALVFQSFLRAVAGREHPLALFLDDLQWIDPASLKLIEVILSDPDRGFLLLLGAYRSNDVDAAHPLRLALERLQRAGTPITGLTLQPLSLADMTQLVADALGSEKEPIRPLAELTWSKTRGNPFFLGQLLSTFEQEELLTRDARSGAWVWDAERIRERMVTDDVIAFMLSKIMRLPEGTRRVLKLAACMGYQFGLRALSTINEKKASETAAELWEALREGLVVPLHDAYRFLDDRGDEGAELRLPPELNDISYRFLHDRVQQAVYSLVGEGERQAAHLRIGRLLLAEVKGAPRDEALFDITNHLNLGAARIDDRGEQLALARLNLDAALKAKAAAAYQAAAEYLRAGLSLLGEAGWDDDYDLMLTLTLERAQCEYVAGAFEAAEASLDVLLARVRSPLERARVHRLRAKFYANAGQFARGLEASRAALALFGIDLPETAEARKSAAAAELREAQANLKGRRFDDLLNAPAMTDPEQQAIVSILAASGPMAYVIDSNLYTFIFAKAVNITLSHGLPELGPTIYVSYAFMLSGWLGLHHEAYELGELAMALCEKQRAVHQEGTLTFFFAIIGMYARPLRASLPFWARAHHGCLESGELIFLSYTAWRKVDCLLCLGDELSAVKEETDRSLALMKRTKNAASEAVLRITKQMIANLLGRTRGRHTLSDEAFDEERFAGTLGQAGTALVAGWYYTVKLMLSFLYEDYEGACAMAPLAEEKNANNKTAIVETERSLFTCLAYCAVYPARGGAERELIASQLAAHQRRLDGWARGCPENFLHKKLLVQAERARLAGDEGAANLYDDAIDAAARNGFGHHEALAHELAARFHLAQGRPRTAQLHRRAAHHGYVRWGAAAKAAQLAEKYPHLIGVSAAESAGDRAESARDRAESAGDRAESAGDRAESAAMTTDLLPDALDVTTVTRAAQAIAGEIVIDRVLERLMRIVIEHAGAQRGVLLLPAESGELMIEATITVDPDAVTVGPPARAEDCGDLALSIVHYVERTREPVVLGDASRESRFAFDAYIASGRPRSVLCLSMMHQGKLTGILYLEHGAAPNVFTPTRIELCTLLASGAAIAVENARLVARAEAAARELRRVNEALEDRITHRTGELREANQRLLLELGERERVEAERARLQEEIIRTQMDRLAEMATPFIPITEQIRVMPLVGTVDDRRARQVIEVLLEGAQAHGASVVIIDITGVRVVDTNVATMLMNAARALRLLGAHVVLTGVRPEVAQTLVQLEVDLASIVTKANLQSGIVYALARSGGGLRARAQGAR